MLKNNYFFGGGGTDISYIIYKQSQYIHNKFIYNKNNNMFDMLYRGGGDGQ